MMSLHKIREWYDRWRGQVYVAYSGGKDSTVLLHLVRQFYPEVPAVFNNTGLEYPEILEQVRGTESVVWLRPKYSFKECCTRWGFPAVSKEVSDKVQRIRNTKDEQLRQLWMYGRNDQGRTTILRLSDKWHFLLQAPFKISPNCCIHLKKNPAKHYEGETGLWPMLGTLAEESLGRTTEYLRFGCNNYTNSRPKSTPLGFWTEQDILQYITREGLKIAAVYGDIVETDGRLRCIGEDRTGCIACPFGCHAGVQNSFQRMAITKPKLLNWILDDLSMRQVLDFTGIPYTAQDVGSEATY